VALVIVLNTSRKPARYSGKIICAEGIDGSGKTTALAKVYERLKAEGRDVLWTEWSDSKVAGKALKKAKKKHRLTALTFTLLQACNIADRLQATILPFLRKGGIVIADRWKYTCYARDVVRGEDPGYVRDVFRFCPDADLAMFFDLEPAVALERKKNFDDEGISYYEAGHDLYPDLSDEDGFLKFQGQVLREYRRFAGDEGMVRVDADRPMDVVEAEAQALVDRLLGERRAA
jgi:dTMP kinase